MGGKRVGRLANSVPPSSRSSLRPRRGEDDRPRPRSSGASAPSAQRCEVLGVVVGLHARLEHLLAQLGEGGIVGGARAVQLLEDAAHAGALQLGEDGVQVARLSAPEVQLSQRARVQALLERRLRVLPQHGADLLGPCDQAGLEEVELVLRVLVRLPHRVGGQR